MGSKHYILLTVDTEASMHAGKPLPVSKMVYGEVNGDFYGISRIMSICDKYGFKATFFVSVLEYLHYGQDEIKKIYETIHERGHDVQLHIHPNWKYKDRFLWQYPLREQVLA